MNCKHTARAFCFRRHGFTLMESLVTYFGTSPGDLSSTYNWCSRFSGRHNGIGNIVFSDAHVGAFKYGYVVGFVAGKITELKRPDINRESDGQ